MAGETQSQVARLVETLEADIIFGRLRPLEELAEDPLMARFHASRHVVRSALDRLVLKGIVIKPQKRTARVRDYSPTEVRELYEVRALLEREAVLAMPLPVDAQVLADLEDIEQDFEAVARDGNDLLSVHRWNDRFHACLYAACGNACLAATILQFTQASNPIRSYGGGDRAWREQSILDHRAMIECLRNGDRARLADLVVRHMHPARDRWLAMRESLRWPAPESPSAPPTSVARGPKSS